jgi:hypothetical protein
LEAASLPTAVPLESVEPRAYGNAADVAAFANRLALGLAAGLIAVLIHGEAARLSSQELTWRALLGS